MLLFKTVIAGDSWGTIAVPVIEAEPLTAVIFMGSLLSLVYGVVNLIVATWPQISDSYRRETLYSLGLDPCYHPALQAVIGSSRVCSFCMSFLGLGPLYVA